MGKRERQRARQLKKKRNQNGSRKIHKNRPSVINDSPQHLTCSDAGSSRKRKRDRVGSNSDDAEEIGNSVFSNAPLSYCLSKSLVVGDGDFTFSFSLAQKWSKIDQHQDLVCTSYDSRESLMRKYGQVEITRTLSALEVISKNDRSELKILHSVDATKLATYFPKGSFSKIIFNFPHTGSQRVHENRNLVTRFFTSCKDVLIEGGQVHITIKICPPYSNWDLEERAKDAGLLLVEVKPFDFRLYPGYRHRTTDPTAKDLNPTAHSKTFIFVPEYLGTTNSSSLSLKRKNHRKKRKHKYSNPPED